MKPKKEIALITGASGRIGDAVMQRLTGRFSDVVGFDRKALTPQPPDCVYIPVDIASDDSVGVLCGLGLICYLGIPAGKRRA